MRERCSPEFRERHIEAPHAGSRVAVDAFLVGVLKGVGKVDLHTAIDCASRCTRAGLYPNKLPVTAVQLLNKFPSREGCGGDSSSDRLFR